MSNRTSRSKKTSPRGSSSTNRSSQTPALAGDSKQCALDIVKLTETGSYFIRYPEPGRQNKTLMDISERRQSGEVRYFGENIKKTPGFDVYNVATIPQFLLSSDPPLLEGLAHDFILQYHSPKSGNIDIQAAKITALLRFIKKRRGDYIEIHNTELKRLSRPAPSPKAKAAKREPTTTKSSRGLTSSSSVSQPGKSSSSKSKSLAKQLKPEASTRRAEETPIGYSLDIVEFGTKFCIKYFDPKYNCECLMDISQPDLPIFEVPSDDVISQYRVDKGVATLFPVMLERTYKRRFSYDLFQNLVVKCCDEMEIDQKLNKYESLVMILVILEGIVQACDLGIKQGKLNATRYIKLDDPKVDDLSRRLKKDIKGTIEGKRTAEATNWTRLAEPPVAIHMVQLVNTEKWLIRYPEMKLDRHGAYFIDEYFIIDLDLRGRTCHAITSMRQPVEFATELLVASISPNKLEYFRNINGSELQEFAREFKCKHGSTSDSLNNMRRFFGWLGKNNQTTTVKIAEDARSILFPTKLSTGQHDISTRNARHRR